MVPQFPFAKLWFSFGFRLVLLCFLSGCSLLRLGFHKFSFGLPVYSLRLPLLGTMDADAGAGVQADMPTEPDRETRTGHRPNRQTGRQTSRDEAYQDIRFAKMQVLALDCFHPSSWTLSLSLRGGAVVLCAEVGAPCW